jgi:hypothetical protein
VDDSSHLGTNCFLGKKNLDVNPNWNQQVRKEEEEEEENLSSQQRRLGLVRHEISIVVWIIRANKDIPSFIWHLPIAPFIIQIRITYLPSFLIILQKTSACLLRSFSMYLFKEESIECRTF